MNIAFNSKLSVDDLVSNINLLLQKEIGLVRVVGEINNPTLAQSGHWYFNLLGNNSTIRCTFFRSYANLAGFKPSEGLNVEAEADVNIYGTRGDIQLIVKGIKPSGHGAQYLAFEKLKNKLQNEGLFSLDRKKKLTKYPHTIGIITSLQTAALQDVLKVIDEQSCHIKVWIYHSSVQGINAPKELINALNDAENHHQAQIILIVRGGGSTEDLACFNDEQLIRRLANYSIPTISGIGHETDISLVDLVCDLRVPTPTAAANYLPKTKELIQNVDNQKTKIHSLINRNINGFEQRLDYAVRFFDNHQQNYLINLNQKLDNHKKMLLQILALFVEKLQQLIFHKHQMLTQTFFQYINQKQQVILSYSNLIKAYDPKHIQKKGYVLITNDQDQIIKSVIDLQVGNNIKSHFVDGIAKSVINKITKRAND